MSTDDEIASLGKPLPNVTTAPEVSGYVGEYCPLIERRCVEQDCMTCSTLENTIGRLGRISWLCSVCSESSKVIREVYWDSGCCDNCGFSTSVLVACRRRKYRKQA